jgi:hypothetical protein
MALLNQFHGRMFPTQKTVNGAAGRGFQPAVTQAAGRPETVCPWVRLCAAIRPDSESCSCRENCRSSAPGEIGLTHPPSSGNRAPMSLR